MTLKDGTTSLETPLQVSEKLHELADGALEAVKSMDATKSKELLYTLNDIETVSYLGKYYAHKIAGATYVALYRETKDKKHQQNAVDELTKAFGFWESYTNKALQQNKNPLWTNRVGIVDWNQITNWVKDDIEIAKKDE